jgi:hypothetical protein
MVSLASISSVHANGVKRAELDWLRKAAQLNSSAAKELLENFDGMFLGSIQNTLVNTSHGEELISR